MSDEPHVTGTSTFLNFAEQVAREASDMLGRNAAVGD
jgi:hypothetical protein